MAGLVTRCFSRVDCRARTSIGRTRPLMCVSCLRSANPFDWSRWRASATGRRASLTHVFKADFWDIDAMTVSATPDSRGTMIVALTRFPVLHAEMRRRGLEEVASRQFDLDEPARLTEAVYRRVPRRRRHSRWVSCGGAIAGRVRRFSITRR